VINQLVTAGLDFSLAKKWAFTGWCRRCVGTWEGDREPWLSDERWKAIGMAPKDVLCDECTHQLKDV
jgi:hypothetical protein